MLAAPIVFLAGPAGAGKSSVGSWIGEDLGFLFLELDLFCLDGVDFHGLRTAWDPFWNEFDAAPVAALIRTKAAQAGAAGAVLSLPGYAVLAPRHVDALKVAGVELVVLFGPEKQCREAFVVREIRTGRRLGSGYWRKFNLRVLEAYGAADYAAARLETFAPDGAFRSREELVGEIRRRVAA